LPPGGLFVFVYSISRALTKAIDATLTKVFPSDIPDISTSGNFTETILQDAYSVISAPGICSFLSEDLNGCKPV